MYTTGKAGLSTGAGHCSAVASDVDRKRLLFLRGLLRMLRKPLVSLHQPARARDTGERDVEAEQ